MIRSCGIPFTVIPASFDRLRSRNPEPAPAEAGGTRRAAALDPRLRGVTPGSCRPLECAQPAAQFAKKGPGGAGASVEETPINSRTLAAATTGACDAHHTRRRRSGVRPRHADHAVAADQRGEAVPAPPLRAGGPPGPPAVSPS